MTEKEALILLNAIPSLSNRKTKELLAYFGSAITIISLKHQDFIASNIVSPVMATKILNFCRGNFLKEESDLIKKHNVTVLTYLDDSFPALLQEIPDVPIILYTKGPLDILKNISMAIVGSRKASIYGRLMADKFASELSQMGLVIVSGLARGIDTAAHKGCLKVGGQTIAVLGSGFAQIYPAENKDLFNEIIKQGVVVSEFPMKTKPLAYNFPVRNRIISGLSLGVLVVEAALRSGALITSRFALEQGREVFAIPGKIDYPTAQGTNHLIQKGAKLVHNVQDIIEEFSPYFQKIIQQIQMKRPLSKHQFLNKNLSQNERCLFNCIQDQPVHVDDLLNRSDLSLTGTMNTLIKLEMKHIIKQLPGKYYIRRSKST